MERKDSGYMSTNEMAEQTKARKEKPLNEYVIALLWLIVMVFPIEQLQSASCALHKRVQSHGPTFIANFLQAHDT
jgi:hypothetical protein